VTTTKAAGESAVDAMRVGRDERERCVDELQEHYAAGRLGDQELLERVGSALTATTRADLQGLLSDLPGGGRVRPAERSRGRVFAATVCGALLVGVLGFGALGGVNSTPPDTSGGMDQTTCLSTGEMTDAENGCPEVSSVQQQIFADADAAVRAAQQLQTISERNPDVQLGGLLERAWASSGRASDAAETSRQLVLAADGNPSEKVLAKAAQAASRAAADTQQVLDAAVKRLDG